jgi:DNA-entry nuclease
MEAWSVEDNGGGICFNVFCYNVQPNIEIDYATGDNWLAGSNNNSSGNISNNTANNTGNNTSEVSQKYILNKNSKKYHYESCSGAQSISAKNREVFNGTKSELEAKGYSSCGICKP